MLIVRKQILLRMEYSPSEGTRAGMGRHEENKWHENFAQTVTPEVSKKVVENIISKFENNSEIYKQILTLSVNESKNQELIKFLEFKKMNNLKDIQTLSKGLLKEDKVRLEENFGLNFDKPIH